MEINKILIDLTEKEVEVLDNYFKNHNEIDTIMKEVYTDEYYISLKFYTSFSVTLGNISHSLYLKVNIFNKKTKMPFKKDKDISCYNLTKLKNICLNFTEAIMFVLYIPNIDVLNTLDKYVLMNKVQLLYALILTIDFLNKDELEMFCLYMCRNINSNLKKGALTKDLIYLSLNKLSYYGYKEIDLIEAKASYEELFKNNLFYSKQEIIYSFMIYCLNLASCNNPINYTDKDIKNMFSELYA